MKAQLRWLAYCFTMLLVACVARGASAADSHRHSLLRAQERLERAIEMAGPADGLIRFAASDIAYLHPEQEIITGRRNTHRFLRSVYPSPRATRLVLDTIAGDSSADGTLGYTFGSFEESRANGALTYGRFLAVWQRIRERWRVRGFLRLEGDTPYGSTPPDALILDGERGVVDFDHPESHATAAAIADARFADLSADQGFTIAFSTYAADAAVIITSNELFWNRAGVEVAFGGWTPEQMLRWHPLRAEAAASGDLAWSVGHGTFEFNDGSTAFTSYSKYMTVWLRTKTGWRFLIDGGNNRPSNP